MNGDGRSKRSKACTTTPGPAPSVYPDGGTLAQYGPFCARCSGPVTKNVQIDRSNPACSKDEALSRLQSEYQQCTLAEGTCPSTL